MVGFMIKLCISLIVSFIATGIIVFRINKAKPGIAPQSVVTLPPEGVYPAEIGYILKHCIIDHDIAAIFARWMCDGTVGVEQGKNLTDTYLIKNKIDKNSPRYQILIYNEIFRNTDRISLDKITSAYPNLVSDTKKRIALKYDEKRTRILSKPIMILQDAVMCAAAFPFAFLVGYGVNANLGAVWLSALIGAAVFLAAYYLNTVFCMMMRYKKAYDFEENKPKKTEYKRLEKKTLYFLTAVAAAFYGVLIGTYFVFGKDGFLSFFAVITTLAGWLCSPTIERLSERGTELTAELNSFKNYMKNTSAFREKAEFRFHSEPNYFNLVLPYAYSMGVGGSWLNAEIYADKPVLPYIEQTDGEKIFSVSFIELSAMFVKALRVKPDKNTKS